MHKILFTGYQSKRSVLIATICKIITFMKLFHDENVIWVLNTGTVKIRKKEHMQQ